METETFWTLLHDSAHWEFELFLMFLFDVLIGMLIWPYIRKFFKHHRKDDKKIAQLEKEVDALKKQIELILPKCGECGQVKEH